MPRFGEMPSPAWDPLFPGPRRAWGSLRETSLQLPPEPEQAAAEKCRAPALRPPPSPRCLRCLDWRAERGHARLTASPRASRLTRCRPSAGPALWEIFPSERQELRHPWDLRWGAFPGLGLGAGSLLLPSKWEGFSGESHSQGCPALPRRECLATGIAVQVRKPGKFLGDSDLMPQGPEAREWLRAPRQPPSRASAWLPRRPPFPRWSQWLLS